MNFHQKLEGKAVKALLVGADIRRALLRDEFSLHVVPKIQIATV
jgi:hypothetical protein